MLVHEAVHVQLGVKCGAVCSPEYPRLVIVATLLTASVGFVEARKLESLHGGCQNKVI